MKRPLEIWEKSIKEKNEKRKDKKKSNLVLNAENCIKSYTFYLDCKAYCLFGERPCNEQKSDSTRILWKWHDVLKLVEM